MIENVSAPRFTQRTSLLKRWSKRSLECVCNEKSKGLRFGHSETLEVRQSCWGFPFIEPLQSVGFVVFFQEAHQLLKKLIEYSDCLTKFKAVSKKSSGNELIYVLVVFDLSSFRINSMNRGANLLQQVFCNSFLWVELWKALHVKGFSLKNCKISF